MNIKTWRKLFPVFSLSLLSLSLKAQDATVVPTPEIKATLDSTMFRGSFDLATYINNQKKWTGKEVVLRGFCVGSREISDEKNDNFILLELDDPFPYNKISVVISEVDADALNFSRYQYHQKALLIKGKLEKSKKFKDEFGNPRLVIYIKKIEQIKF
jgi:hypothetical protein